MILDQLAETARERVAEAKKHIPAGEMEAAARRFYESAPRREDFAFEKALRRPDGDVAFICEVKKASPSKGLIAADFPYMKIARDYEAAGAAAISVLTEPSAFMGSMKYLAEIASGVGIPVLRKDFTVDDYMIYEARAGGADAVLLICAILDTDTIREYIRIADSLGLTSVVEAHDESEVRSALAAGARVIGVNNRNLQDFNVDIGVSGRLRHLIPAEITFISESGIKTAADIAKLRENGTDAVLIGETLMRSSNRRAAIEELRGN